MVLGEYLLGKIAPNPKNNPNPNRGPIFLEVNCSDTDSYRLELDAAWNTTSSINVYEKTVIKQKK